jgi:hypothetical protein
MILLSLMILKERQKRAVRVYLENSDRLINSALIVKKIINRYQVTFK